MVGIDRISTRGKEVILEPAITVLHHVNQVLSDNQKSHI